MTTIKEEFTRLILDIYPAPAGGCSLTHKKRKAFEKLYFTAYRSCFAMIMLNSGKSEEEAKKVLDAKCEELDSFFSALEKETASAEGNVHGQN